MSDRSFIESWSLDVDDIAFVEGFNLVSRIWVAFQLRFFRVHGRFPSRIIRARTGISFLLTSNCPVFWCRSTSFAHT